MTRREVLLIIVGVAIGAVGVWLWWLLLWA